jgi:hypothetical protein
MSTIIVASILVGAVIVICGLLISVADKQKVKKRNQLLNRFSELGTIHNLSFSSQEVLNNSIIGLDGINRKILVLSQIDNSLFDDQVVDLNEVKNCTVKKYHVNIEADDAKNKRMEAYLEKLVLHFEFYTENEPVEVVFYNHIHHNIYHLADIEQKADYWRQILTKMLRRSVERVT